MKATRAAAALYVVLGLGFGAGSIWPLIYYASSGALPMTPFGFRSLAGPFEELGRGRFLTLGWSLVGLCFVDAVAGVWLWRGRERGRWLGLATDVPLFALALGFALPLLLIGIPIRAALAVAGKRTTH